MMNLEFQQVQDEYSGLNFTNFKEYEKDDCWEFDVSFKEENKYKKKIRREQKDGRTSSN